MSIAKRFIDHFEEVFLVILMPLMSLMVIIQVSCRFLFHFPTPWAEELLKYFFIWSIMIGSSLGVKRQAHIGVSLLVSKLPLHLHRIVKIISTLAVVLVCAMFVEASWGMVVMQKASNQILPASGVPIYTSSLAIPVGFTLIALRSLAVCHTFWRGDAETPPGSEVL